PPTTTIDAAIWHAPRGPPRCDPPEFPLVHSHEVSLQGCHAIGYADAPDFGLGVEQLLVQRDDEISNSFSSLNLIARLHGCPTDVIGEEPSEVSTVQQSVQVGVHCLCGGFKEHRNPPP